MLRAVATSSSSGGPGSFTTLTASDIFTQAAEDGITAHAGGGQASATPLSATKNLHRISVCATAADSVLMPPALAGQSHYLRNDGAAFAGVFPTGAETINGLATVALPAGQGMWLGCTTTGAWTTAGIFAVNGSAAVPAIQISNSATGFFRVGSNLAGTLNGNEVFRASASIFLVPGGVTASGVGTFTTLKQGAANAVVAELPTNYFLSQLADGTSIKVFYTPA